MRSLFALVLTAFSVHAVPAAAAPAVPPACVALARTWQSIELACPLEAVAPQRYRFSAKFSGSHDDTALSLASTLDGAPIACDAGSKTESNGEDGDIVLECRFAMAQPTAGGALRVRMKWYHATYEGHAFAAVDATP